MRLRLVGKVSQEPTLLSLVRFAAEHVTGPHQCLVIDGWFSILVQGLLFIVTVATVVVKWLQENPRRSFYVFLLDCSKQLVGGAMIHIWNLIGAIWLDSQIDFGDQCTWYWLNVMVDTTLGVLVAYGLLQASMRVWKYDSGNYVGPDGELDYNRWLVQVGHWLLIVTMMKFICIMTIFVGRYPLNGAAEGVLLPLAKQEEAKLVVVMIVTPGVMNIFQFCVQDQFLKFQGSLEQLKEAQKGGGILFD